MVLYNVDKSIMGEVNKLIKQIDEMLDKTEDFDPASFVENTLKKIEDRKVRQLVTIHYLDRIKGISAFTDSIVREATLEEKQELFNIYKQKGILSIEFEFLSGNSIEIIIAKMAAQKWNQPEPQTLSQAMKITDKTEESVVEGIAEVMGWEADYGVMPLRSTLLKDIYLRDTISDEIAQEMRSKLSGEDKYRHILKILSIIHDDWVSQHGNNFLKVGREKERQFVPLELLNWEEVKSDLLFLDPVLEAAGIEVNEEELKKEFIEMQKKYLSERGITDHESLVVFLSNPENYSNLQEVVTTRTVSELLQHDGIAEQMARQIESSIGINSEEQKEKSCVTPESIAEADRKQELTTTEVGLFKRLIDRIKETINKIKGEK